MNIIIPVVYLLLGQRLLVEALVYAYVRGLFAHGYALAVFVDPGLVRHLGREGDTVVVGLWMHPDGVRAGFEKELKG